MSTTKTVSSALARAPNPSSALATSSLVARPVTFSSPSAGASTRKARFSFATPSRSDACASVVPHLWKVLPCSGSPARPTTISRKACSIGLYQPHQAAVAPLGARQTHERHQDDRHVPELALLHGGDAAAAVADVFRDVGHRGGRVELAARLLGNAAQRGGVHHRVEVLRVARRRANVAGARPERLVRLRGIHRHFVGSGLCTDEQAR